VRTGGACSAIPKPGRRDGYWIRARNALLSLPASRESMGRSPTYHFGVSSAILVFLVFFVPPSGFGLYRGYSSQLPTARYFCYRQSALSSVLAWSPQNLVPGSPPEKRNNDRVPGGKVKSYQDPRKENEIMTGSPQGK